MLINDSIKMSFWQRALYLGWPVWALLLILGWIIAIVGHLLISYHIISNSLLIAMTDSFVHAFIAFLIIVPFFLDRSPLPITLLVIAITFCILLDLDHIIAAGSFNLQALLSLPMRPYSHSIVFGTIIAGIVSLFYLKNQMWKFAFYIVAISLISHVLRDGCESNLTPWAFPFKSFPIPSYIMFLFFISSSYLHLYFTYSTEWKISSENIDQSIKIEPNIEQRSRNRLDRKSQNSFILPKDILTCFTQNDGIKAVYTSRFIGLRYDAEFHDSKQNKSSLEERFKSRKNNEQEMSDVDIESITQWYKALIEESHIYGQDGDLFEEFKHAELLSGTRFFQMYNSMVLLERFHLMAAQFAILPNLWGNHFNAAVRFFAARKNLIEIYFPIIESHFHLGQILNKAPNSFSEEITKFKKNYPTEDIAYICDEIMMFLKDQLFNDHNKLIQFWKKNADIAARNCLNNKSFLAHAFKNPYKMTTTQLIENTFNRQKISTQFLNQLFDKATIPTYPVRIYESTVFCTLLFHLYSPLNAYLWKTFISIAIGLAPDLPKLIFRVFRPDPYQNQDDPKIRLIPPARLYLPEKAFFIDPPAMLKKTQNRQEYKFDIGHRGLEHTLPGLDRICQKNGIEPYVVDQYIIRIWYYTIKGQEDSFQAFKQFIMLWTQPGCHPDKEWMPLNDAIDEIDEELMKKITPKITLYLEQENESNTIDEVWDYRVQLIDRLRNNNKFRQYLHGWYTHGM